MDGEKEGGGGGEEGEGGGGTLFLAIISRFDMTFMANGRLVGL